MKRQRCFKPFPVTALLFLVLSRVSGKAFHPRRGGVFFPQPSRSKIPPPQNISLVDNVENGNPIELADSISNRLSIRNIIHWMIPSVSTLGAFLFFRTMAQSFHSTVRWLAIVTETWVPYTLEEIDLQTQVVTQVINGPVITSISLLFATLVSVTLSTLHNRQVEIFNTYSQEMQEAKHLQSLVQHLKDSQVEVVQPMTRSLTKALLHESFRDKPSPEVDTRIDTILFQIHSWMRSDSSPLLMEAQNTLLDVAKARKSHFTKIDTHFPAMHYLTLCFMALSIMAAFLIATDQELNVLESIPVRLLWSILVGSFSSLAVVCYDLSTPFAGVYKVASSVVANDDSLFGR